MRYRFPATARHKAHGDCGDDALSCAYRFVGEGGFTLAFHSPGVLTLDQDTTLTFEGYASAEALDGRFGLHLFAEGAAPVTNLTLEGDLLPLDFDPAAPGRSRGPTRWAMSSSARKRRRIGRMD